MTLPIITSEAELPLAERIAQFVPHQGSFEYQNDQAGKTHQWHRHSLDETLFVLSGQMEVFWWDGQATRRRVCPANTKISLPADTVHGSTAGSDGCTYIIAPADGATAVTTFLDTSEYPSR